MSLFGTSGIRAVFDRDLLDLAFRVGLAVGSEGGIAITMARPVTHKVPTINGKKPNAPCKGCQAVENNNSVKGLAAKIGCARV